MDVDQDDAVIVRSTIDLGHDLGLRVVAEGVETPEAWRLLVDLNCDVAQGFYVSRPMPAADLPRWIREWEDAASLGGSPARLVLPN